MNTVEGEPSRIWDKTVSAGNFLVATMGLFSLLVAAWVQINVQRAEDHTRIESLSAQVTRQQGILDSVQQQQTVILVEVSSLKGEVHTLVAQLSAVDGSERRPKGK